METTYSTIAEPSKLLVNDSLFTELPYNEKIYVKKDELPGSYIAISCIYD